LIQRKTASKLKVVVGQVSAINLDPNEQKMSVYTITPGPNYNSTLKTNDIALLKVYDNISLVWKISFKNCIISNSLQPTLYSITSMSISSPTTNWTTVYLWWSWDGEQLL
jgi:hypothetical protein